EVRAAVIESANEIHELDEAGCPLRTTADVERLSRRVVNTIVRRDHRVDEIVNEEHVTHLHAVAINRDRLAFHTSNDEVRHPSLIFGAKLMGTVDAAHPKDNGR